MIRKVAIVTDGWYPVVDGVVRAVDATKKELEKRGVEVTVIHPGLFRNVPMLLEFQLRVALSPRTHMRTLIQNGNFDAIHIETEGTLGWAAKAVCRQLKLPYTTTHQTRLAIWIRSRIMPGFDRPVYAYLRKFHSGATRTMVSTPSFRDDLMARGFKNLVVRPLGVNVDRSNPNRTRLPFRTPSRYLRTSAALRRRRISRSS